MLQPSPTRKSLLKPCVLCADWNTPVDTTSTMSNGLQTFTASNRTFVLFDSCFAMPPLRVRYRPRYAPRVFLGVCSSGGPVALPQSRPPDASQPCTASFTAPYKPPPRPRAAPANCTWGCGGQKQKVGPARLRGRAVRIYFPAARHGPRRGHAPTTPRKPPATPGAPSPSRRSPGRS